MLSQVVELIEGKRKFAITAHLRPDGDSLGSALALEEVLGDAGKEISLYCPVEIPKYLRYLNHLGG